MFRNIKKYLEIFGKCEREVTLSEGGIAGFAGQYLEQKRRITAARAGQGRAGEWGEGWRGILIGRYTQARLLDMASKHFNGNKLERYLQNSSATSSSYDLLI